MVEIVINVCRFLLGNAKTQRVGIVEKKNCPQQSAFSNALRANKMHITVEIYFGVFYLGAVDKYDFIQVSHNIDNY
jgi:hypothetical protein